MSKTVSKFALSIRNVPYFSLKGDDATAHNRRLGSTLRGSTPLRGLDFEEEKKYLPMIINVPPTSPEYNRAAMDYWNAISVSIPVDDPDIEDELQGKPLTITVDFGTEEKVGMFEKITTFTGKAEFITGYGTVVDGIADYLLFQFALKHSKVANDVKLIRMSAKIDFYLFSLETERASKVKVFNDKAEAKKKFYNVLQDEGLIDAGLLAYGKAISGYKTPEDKHIALEAEIDKNPTVFVQAMADPDIKFVSFIKKSVEKGNLYNPENTDSYYFGENKELCIGGTMRDAVLYLKSEGDKNQEILNILKAKMSL